MLSLKPALGSRRLLVDWFLTAEYTIPPLTTVRMSCKDLAQKAVDILLSNLLEGTDKPEVTNKINTRLIVRQTTSLPKDALLDLIQQPLREKGNPKPQSVSRGLGSNRTANRVRLFTPLND
jgi:Periplasmic binding protein-like domain